MIEKSGKLNNFLIVDDNSEIRDYLKELLVNIGYSNITCTETGNDTAALLENQNFDVVFLDIELPDSNGKQLLELIGHKHPTTKVVMCSGYNTLENVKETWEKGALGFVAKPFTSKKIVNVMKRLETTL